jgi:hypothetical protein
VQNATIVFGDTVTKIVAQMRAGEIMFHSKTFLFLLALSLSALACGVSAPPVAQAKPDHQNVKGE